MRKVDRLLLITPVGFQVPIYVGVVSDPFGHPSLAQRTFQRESNSRQEFAGGDIARVYFRLEAPDVHRAKCIRAGCVKGLTHETLTPVGATQHIPEFQPTTGLLVSE